VVASQWGVAVALVGLPGSVSEFMDVTDEMYVKFDGK
jgi:hypothetical protein